MEKHYEKVFEVAKVNLRLKKLGLADFPAFKTVYANAISEGDAEGITKAYLLLLSWLQHEVLGEWVPVFDKKKQLFMIDVLNDETHADTIINILLGEILAPLFQNTADSMK